MDIHKPKPWHGWREFLKEIGTIVIGVLIALGAEQAVELVHAQAELSETREALRQEIAENAGTTALGAAQDHCRDARADLQLAWARGGPKPELRPSRLTNMVFSAWDVAKAGPLAKMPVKERLTYSRLYDAFAAQEVNITNQMNELLETSKYTGLDTLGPDQAQRLMELLNRARTTRAVKAVAAAEVLSAVKALNIHPEPPTEESRRALSDLCKAAGVPSPAL